MVDVQLRPAGVADAKAVAALVGQAYAPYLARMDRRPAPLDVDYARALSVGGCWVVVSGAEILGVVLTALRPDHLLVENLAVAPAARGRGVGARLLARAEAHALATGRGEVRLYTNQVMTENLAYYPRRGYTETGRAEQDGFRRVFFAKTVGRSPEPER